MHDRSLIKDFWSCGDNEIIEFALERARLNRMEKAVCKAYLDELKTQEETAEELNISTRSVQKYWYNASFKLLSIPWLVAYAKEIRSTK